MTLFPLISLAASTAFAANGDPDWQQACRATCERDGFSVTVYEHIDNGSIKLAFDVGTAVQIIDSAHYQSGDVYVGYQSNSQPLAGGPYCGTFPGAAGHFIIGHVYERYTSNYSWQHEETGTLQTDVTTACGAPMWWLLDTLELYGVNGTPLPQSCTDIGCASGDGVDGEDPGSGTWEYTDASGESQSFDSLTDDDDDDGAGGITVSKGTFTTRAASRSR